MTSNAEEFRRCADECYRLSARLKSPEHKAFAVYLAGAWLALAEQAERKARRDVEVPLTEAGSTQLQLLLTKAPRLGQL